MGSKSQNTFKFYKNKLSWSLSLAERELRMNLRELRQRR